MAANQGCKGNEEDIQTAAFALAPLLRQCALSWYSRWSFALYTRSSCLKPFYPIINLSLSHAVFTFVVSQHPEVNFSRFQNLSSNKSQQDALFNTGAIPQRSVHGYLSLTSTRPRIGRCAVSVSTDGIASDSISCCCRVIVKVHLIL